MTSLTNVCWLHLKRHTLRLWRTHTTTTATVIKGCEKLWQKQNAKSIKQFIRPAISSSFSVSDLLIAKRAKNKRIHASTCTHAYVAYVYEINNVHTYTQAHRPAYIQEQFLCCLKCRKINDVTRPELKESMTPLILVVWLLFGIKCSIRLGLDHTSQNI